jgi:hypothetical protein
VLCVGYFAGFGTTTRVNVCGNPYRVHVRTQAFSGHRHVAVHYRIAYLRG